MRDTIIDIPSGPFTISTRVVGEGPLVILMHGFPELALCWRHQMHPLAQAGFTVAAPDMRGYGASSCPEGADAYTLDILADDMAAIADALGHERWVTICHDFGALVGWRTALRFPDRVAAIFALSVPYQPPSPLSLREFVDEMFPDEFMFIRYYQDVGVAEAELESDVRNALKQIHFNASGDAPMGSWLAPRPKNDTLLRGILPAPDGPLSFLPDAILDQYVEAFERNGFSGPLSWYRAPNAAFSTYPDPHIRQPAGFLCGEKEPALGMFPGSFEKQREFVADLRTEIVLPEAGHWIQQERPAEVNSALLRFLENVKPLI